MKKLLATVLTILSCGAAYALPVGNPADASLLRDGIFCEGHCGDPCDPCLSWCDAWSIRVGFYGDYVFNRHMEVDRGNNQANPDIDDFEIFTNAAYIALNLWDRVDIFTTLGASNFALETNQSAFLTAGAAGTAEARFFADSSTDFSWSIGGRVTLWECGCTMVGLEGQYFSAHLDVNRVDVRGLGRDLNEVKARYREWQVGLGIAHRINMVVPYIAVKWSGCKLKPDSTGVIDPTYTFYDLENKNDWGFAVGATLIGWERLSVTAEGRFGDEKAVHVNAQFRI